MIYIAPKIRKIDRQMYGQKYTCLKSVWFKQWKDLWFEKLRLLWTSLLGASASLVVALLINWQVRPPIDNLPAISDAQNKYR